MGSELADREKRPEHQPEWQQREQSRSQQNWAQQTPPLNNQQPLLIHQPKLRVVPDPDDPTRKKVEGDLAPKK
jgi:hypothetical protein